ncbi:hypothetical protein SBA2_450043 [Acidobacteriia bacterium SbA2]|nr:hypothetical protein SBA2_450043 [Acidobacteriia bacterium SbA2]
MARVSAEIRARRNRTQPTRMPEMSLKSVIGVGSGCRFPAGTGPIYWGYFSAARKSQDFLSQEEGLEAG